MDVEKAIKKLREINQNLEHLGALSALAQWDMRTFAPRKALPDRGELLAYLSAEMHKCRTDEQIPELIETAKQAESFTDVERAMLRDTEKRYLQAKKVPTDRMVAYTKTISQSEAVWLEAKEKNDWKSFEPYLQQVFEFQKEMAEYYGYTESPYDALLEQYEPGTTVKLLEPVFSELRDESVSLLKEIQGSGVKIDKSILTGDFLQEDIKAFASAVIQKIGFDFDAGRLDVSLHPFTTAFGNQDIRITTFYPKGEFAAPLFATIHESGHGIFQQQVSETLKGTGLGTNISMGLHESQSRFFENMIGRNRAFWKYFYPELQKVFPAFSDIKEEQFYSVVNAVEPGLIRTRADELTYNLHIIIRYELEKALLENTLTVKELPEAWNEKYQKYLGITPPDDTLGVMQDTHWASGAIGYFPSYTLGNLYSAQFAHVLEQEISDWQEQMARGEFSVIRNWLGEKIHRHGAVYLPEELLFKVTGEHLQPKYFTAYLRRKFSEIYDL